MFNDRIQQIYRQVLISRTSPHNDKIYFSSKSFFNSKNIIPDFFPKKDALVLSQTK